jgi:hypothetical protein
MTMEHPDQALKNAITEYEDCCNRGSAQSMEAKGLLEQIKASLKYRGMEYNTLNLARFGSRRALGYIKRGLVDGYVLIDGAITKVKVNQ